MADGKGILGERRAMTSVRLLETYLTPGGPQLNRGEQVSVPEDEAETLIREGAAVRVQGIEGYDAVPGKAPARPPQDKMMRPGAALTK